MASGVYKIPKPFKDEDLWFKFFTKTQLIALGIALMVGAVPLIGLAKIGLFPLGLIFFLLIVGGTAACFMFNMPEDKYLLGGGEKIATIVFRLLRKKIFGRVIYVKNYDKEG